VTSQSDMTGMDEKTVASLQRRETEIEGDSMSNSWIPMPHFRTNGLCAPVRGFVILYERGVKL